MLCAHQIKMDDQASRGVKNFNTVNFLYTINVINVELSMMLLLIQFVTISSKPDVFQGNNNARQLLTHMKNVSM